MASFEKRGKSWSVVFMEFGKKKRLSGNYPTKKDAQIAYEDYIANRTESGEDMAFSKLVELYMQNQKTRVRESTYYTDMHRLSHISFDCPVNALTMPQIQSWMQSLSSYSYKYQKSLFTLLNSILKYGSDVYNLPNIMDKAKPPRNVAGKKEMQIWSPEQFRSFIKHCPADFVLMFRLFYATGCRKGEVLALQWDDLKDGVLRINKSMTNHSVDGIKITATKNDGSNRSIPLPLSLANDLEAVRSSGFMFGGDKPIAQETLRRAFIKGYTDANLPPIRIHDLRHSCASLLISKGVSIVAVSKRLGHNSVEQTLNTYSHLMPDDNKMILSALNEI